MRIETVRIQNFRTFMDETVHLDNYTCLVGSNGAGKSTVLTALNVFFRQYTDSKTDLSKLSADDFHHRNTQDPIEITVTFKDLSEQAKTSLSDYVRQGRLVVTARAEYDEIVERAEVKQYGSRLGMTEFRPWFEAEKDKASAQELKDIFLALREEWPEINKASSKAAMAEALREFEARHPESCILIPSADQFYGVSKGANRLEPHIQWVFVPASKDISEEAEESKTSALGQLLMRAVRGRVGFAEKVEEIKRALQNEYQAMLDAEQSALEDVSSSLQAKLRIWAKPDARAQVQWKHDPDKSIRVEEPTASVRLGERAFESELSRFGHGMQRSYMLALLQEIAETGESDAPTLVMGIEEPELYQHPPQTRYLSEVLQNLAHDENQIVVCSHSPHFIPADDFAAVRVVREQGHPPSTRVSYLTYTDLNQTLVSAGAKHLKEEGLLAKLYPVLRPELSEMFFCRRLTLVEGMEDVAYLMTYIHLMGKSDEFRMGGFHIVPTHGKSEILKPAAMAQLLDIPMFVMCDADTDSDEKWISEHKRDNRSVLDLLGHSHLSEWPTETLVEHNLRMWRTNLTNTVEEELGVDWKQHLDRAAADYGNAGRLRKNPLAASRALEYAWANGERSASLCAVVENVLALGQH